MRRRILATDFDGTLVTHEYPKIGKPLPMAFATLRALKANGVRLMLWTMRGHPDLSKFPHLDLHTGNYIPQDTLQEAVNFCLEQGVEFDGVNLSPEQFSTSNKQYAHLYIDDAALGCPLTEQGYVDWLPIVNYLRGRGWLSRAQHYLILNELGYYHGHYQGDPADLEHPELPYIPYV